MNILLKIRGAAALSFDRISERLPSKCRRFPTIHEGPTTQHENALIAGDTGSGKLMEGICKFWKVGPVLLTASMAFILVGCGGPSEESRAQKIERERIECLDKPCAGDVTPTVDRTVWSPFKVGGQWFIGPKNYFSSGINGAVFYWPSRTPMAGLPDGAPYPEQGSPFYDVAIEIFLRSKATRPAASSMYELLLKEEADGRVQNKIKIRAGLEAWHINGLVEPEVWYIATGLQDPGGRPVTLMCRGGRPSDRCTAGFTWETGVSVSLRFRAKHAEDWPEIYQEVVRVLQMIEKA